MSWLADGKYISDQTTQGHDIYAGADVPELEKKLNILKKSHGN